MEFFIFYFFIFEIIIISGLDGLISVKDGSGLISVKDGSHSDP
jgi:hypothetical protein